MEKNKWKHSIPLCMSSNIIHRWWPYDLDTYVWKPYYCYSVFVVAHTIVEIMGGKTGRSSLFLTSLVCLDIGEACLPGKGLPDKLWLTTYILGDLPMVKFLTSNPFERRYYCWWQTSVAWEGIIPKRGRHLCCLVWWEKTCILCAIPSMPNKSEGTGKRKRKRKNCRHPGCSAFPYIYACLPVVCLCHLLSP